MKTKNKLHKSWPFTIGINRKTKKKNKPSYTSLCLISKKKKYFREETKAFRVNVWNFFDLNFKIYSFDKSFYKFQEQWEIESNCWWPENCSALIWFFLFHINRSIGWICTKISLQIVSFFIYKNKMAFLYFKKWFIR